MPKQHGSLEEKEKVLEQEHMISQKYSSIRSSI
jgi:hypothetical protein